MNKLIVIVALSLAIVAFCQGKELSEYLQDEKFAESVKDCILDSSTCEGKDMEFKVRSKIYFTLYLYILYSMLSIYIIFYYIILNVASTYSVSYTYNTLYLYMISLYKCKFANGAFVNESCLSLANKI